MSSPQPYLSADDKFAPGADNVRKVEYILTADEIKELYTNPFLLVPAPGTGNIISPVKAYIHYMYGSIAYTQPGNTNITEASNNLIQFGNFLNLTANKYTVVFPSSVTLTPNTAVYLANTTADPTNGDGTLKIEFYYQIVKE